MKIESPNVAEEVAANFTERLRRDLSRHTAYNLLDSSPTNLVDDMFALLCFDLDSECLAKLGDKYSASSILVVDLGHGDPGYVVDLKLVDGATGRNVATFRRVDVARTDLEKMAGDGLASLLGEPPPTEPRKGTVVVRASVPGARVRVGEVAGGEAPFEVEVPPGEYPVSVSRDGFLEHVRRVEVQSGATTRVDVVLAEIPPPEPVESVAPDHEAIPPEEPLMIEAAERAATPLYKRWWFWTGIGAVVAGSVVTTVLLLYDDSGASKSGHLDLSLRPWEIGLDPVFQRQ